MSRRPVAARLVVPLDRAKDFTALASALKVLGERDRLRAIQLLLEGPKVSKDLPIRVDELRMPQDVGIVSSERVPGTRGTAWRWTLLPEALKRVADCLRIEEQC